MARIIAALLCHGEFQQLPGIPSAQQPFALNELGRQQALDAAILLRDFASKHQLQLHPELDCSSSLNAWQTAKIIGRELHDSVNEPPTLSAYNRLLDTSMGSAANLSCAQIEDSLQADPRYDAPPENWMDDSNYRLPFAGAESHMESGDRCAEHIVQRITAIDATANADNIKLFVGHNKSLLHAAFLLGVISFDALSKLELHPCKPIFIERDNNGSWRQCGGLWKQLQAAS
ncbi:histidine phosphatase family protein [Spongiibacter sp. KMU-158]|uniref:Histidine phosphatase family protein n=1 Tax=Spongiibacter pelagi TaxID=2760804 RepID=A0A927BYF3_9GAMM|nr:histidine phosphatase family protein [Spongiibacter pelagi]MBD2857863.1 histidine phosphatase family protein [Spongiibacter pelagi]